VAMEIRKCQLTLIGPGPLTNRGRGRHGSRH
jgi:hypothetical protein